MKDTQQTGCTDSEGCLWVGVFYINAKSVRQKLLHLWHEPWS